MKSEQWTWMMCWCKSNGVPPANEYFWKKAEEEYIKSKDIAPDYEGFVKHLEELDGLDIPRSINGLAELARRYHTPIPRFIEGTPVFERSELPEVNLKEE